MENCNITAKKMLTEEKIFKEIVQKEKELSYITRKNKYSYDS